MPTPNEQSPEVVIEGLNEDAEHRLGKNAEALRRDIILETWNSVTKLLDLDRQNTTAALNLAREGLVPDGGILLSTFVFSHSNVALYKDGQPVRTRSVLLTQGGVRPEESARTLQLHTPCDEQNNPIEEPGVVFIRRKERRETEEGDEEVVEYLLVATSMAHHYEPAEITDIEEGDRILTEADIDKLTTRGATLLVPELAQLSEDILSMRAVHQGEQVIRASRDFPESDEIAS